MSLENEMKNQTLAIKEQTAAITAQTAAMTELFNNFIFNAASSSVITHSEIKTETVGDVSQTVEKTSEIKVNAASEEASQADSETADKINAEAKKKALAKSKAKAKAEAEKLKAEAEEDAKDDAPGQEVEVSADDLKAACLTAARAEEGNKVKVKKLLASYDATVVKDVAPGDRAEILAKLEAGEF